MPTQGEIQKIKNLAKNGESVNQIKEQLELPKSTVYYHFRKEVGQKQKENQLKIPDDPEFKGELCGIFAGDGSHHYYPEKYKHDIRISLNLKDNYWCELKAYLTENLGKEPFLIKEKDKNNITLKYTSQTLYQFLKAHLNWGEDKTLTISLEKGHNFENSFYKGFLRGLIDTDGYKRRDHNRFVFATISRELREDISTCLFKYKIEHTNFQEEPQRQNWRTIYKIRITGSDVDRFNKIVKPRHPKKSY